MALLFNRISKLSARKENVGFFFSAFPQSPCLLLSCKNLRESPDGTFVTHRLFDPTTIERVYSKEMKVPNELLSCKKLQPLLGASQGWVASLGNKDLTVNLTDMYKQGVSSPTVISLPPIGFKPSTPAPEVSLSSSDPVQDDYFVAAKFNEFHLSVCRPRWDSKWTHIGTPSSLLPASDLMYSKRDKAFYFTSFKGLYIGSLDQSSKLNYQDIRL